MLGRVALAVYDLFVYIRRESGSPYNHDVTSGGHNCSFPVLLPHLLAPVVGWLVEALFGYFIA
jgi:hypothetical protein